MSISGLPAYRQSYLRIAAAVAILVGAFVGNGMTEAHAQEVLRLPIATDFDSFDPDNAFEMDGLAAINNVYEGLVEYVPGSAEIRGLLAKDWTISEDGLTYTFNLVEGATFHDGTPFNAEAVVTAFTRRRDSDLILSYFLWNLKAIEATGENTVVLTLGMPQPSLLDSLASPWGPKVISPTALAEHAGEDNATSWLDTNAVGTGPFTLASFDRGQGYSFERFADYHGEPAFFDTIELPLIPEVSQQVLNLQAEETDAVPANYPWAQLAALPPGLEITSAPSTSLIIGFVKPESPLNEPEIRTAFLTAINPAGWVADAYGAYGHAAKSLYPTIMLDPATPLTFPSDEAAAKATVAAKGPITLTIGISTEEANSLGRVGDLMVAELAAIGIDATITILPSGAAFGLAENPNGPDFYMGKLTPDALHPENQASIFFTEKAPINFYGRALPEADALVAEAGTLTDIAARNALYEEASRLYVENGLFIPLVEVDDVVVHPEGLVDLGLRAAYAPGNIDYGSVRWAD
ncbi:hemin ABC transporter substrate-binding protein [Devosia sp. Root685]|uniref:ABC transporter substrate-binding protein n=1 Tax=Devosia sp. Root685 TaxID=1736587 RepID=UPI0006F6B2DC|nr:ABC transporter substrate-binding protein [Devosia sp. Root685]KRA95085.1 hemin ABC transporter substrate-binding protein [Devosia sp. Root685]